MAVEKRGTLRSMKCRMATEVRYPSHIPRVFSHEALGFVMAVADMTCMIGSRLLRAHATLSSSCCAEEQQIKETAESVLILTFVRMRINYVSGSSI